MKIMRTEEHIGEKIRTRVGKKVASVALAALMIPGLFSVVWAEDTDPAVLYTAVAASEKSSDTVQKEISRLSIREFRGGAAKKKEIVLKWKRNTEADAYSIQRYSKRTGLYREIAVLTAKSGTSTCRYVDRGVKKGHYYCYRIRIRKDVDGNALYGQTSRSIGVYLAPDGSKKNNVSRVATKKKSYRLVTGATVKPVVTLKTGRAGQKPYKMTKSWYSSDERIAAVSAKGRICAKDQGECYIYCAAHNGKRAKIHVMVGMDPKQKIKTVPILTFHRIVPDKIKKRYYADNQWVAALSDFRKQIRYLHDNGFKTISADQFRKWYRGDIELPQNSVMLTIDDGFYEGYYLVYPVIREYKMKMTSFLVGTRTQETTEPYDGSAKERFIGWDKVREVREEYPQFEFQAHSWDLHHYENGKGAVYSRSYDELTEDLKKCTDEGYDYIAYPYGFAPENYLQAARHSEMKMAFGFDRHVYARRSDDPYNIRRLKVNGFMTMKKFRKLVRNY